MLTVQLYSGSYHLSYNDRDDEGHRDNDSCLVLRHGRWPGWRGTFHIMLRGVTSLYCSIHVNTPQGRLYLQCREGVVSTTDSPQEWKMFRLLDDTVRLECNGSLLRPNHLPTMTEWKMRPVSGRVGVVHWGGKYQLGRGDKLVEGCKLIHKMGARCCKIYLGVKQETYSLDYGEAKTLQQIASLPSYKQVLGMGWETVVLISHAFEHVRSQWWKRLHPDSSEFAELLQQESRELYSLAMELSQYSGTKFVISNWEGDCLTHERTDCVYEGFARWIRCRQEGVTLARSKGATNVYHCMEVNRVLASVLDKTVSSVTTRVLPKIHTDYLSYSCYDCPDKASFESCVKHLLSFNDNLIIGEFGVPMNVWSEDVAQTYVHGITTVVKEYGLEAALYWQIYDNEMQIVDGVERWNGFGLIDKQGHVTGMYLYLRYVM